MATTVDIKVDGKDIYTTSKRHKGGDDIEFTCNHLFTVDFGLRSPLSAPDSSLHGEFDGAVYRTLPNIDADADLKKRAEPVICKYTVAVYAPDPNDPAEHIILIADPEIIIDP